jgi:hypothetical protein
MRHNSPARWLTDGPLKAGMTVEYRQPGAETTVQAEIIAVDTDGPGTVMHAQYTQDNATNDTTN